MAIEWNRVTRLSQLAAILLGIGIFCLGFWLGARSAVPAAPPAPAGVTGDASYQCAQGKSLHAVFYDDRVTVMLSDGRTLNLSHALSGSGARYASEDDATVFWEKGATAFVEEGGQTTYADCESAPIPL